MNPKLEEMKMTATITRKKIAAAAEHHVGYARGSRRAGVSRTPATWNIFADGELAAYMEGNRCELLESYNANRWCKYGTWKEIQAFVAKHG